MIQEESNILNLAFVAEKKRQRDIHKDTGSLALGSG